MGAVVVIVVAWMEQPVLQKSLLNPIFLASVRMNIFATFLHVLED